MDTAAPPPTLLAFAGSLRRESHQRRLLRHVAAGLAPGCRIAFLEPDPVRLPMFNQDLESDAGIRAELVALHAQVAAADGLLIASPEYNGGVAPYLKNTIDWLSRLPRIDPAYADRWALRHKPVLLLSASTGWSGGLLGLQSTRALFSYVGALVHAETICVAHADHWQTAEGYGFEPDFDAHVRRVANDFVALASTLRNPRSDD